MKGCRSLTDKEIENVFNELKTLRDKALFVLGVKSGLRISELLSLNIKDVVEYGVVGSQVTVAKRNTKGKAESKTLPLTVSAKEALQKYLDSIGTLDLNEPLFKSTKANKRIGRMQAHRILKDAFTALELKGNCSSHSLRKSYAHRVHKALGNDILKTQVALSHKSLSSTAQYLQVDRAEVEDAIRGLG